MEHCLWLLWVKTPAPFDPLFPTWSSSLPAMKSKEVERLEKFYKTASSNSHKTHVL